jgi:HD superfamily phosphohydrolase
MINNNNSSYFDPQSNLLWRFDAVHGYIDITDATNPNESGIIAKLLRSPFLERLRRIKQLGFASLSYLSDDHSRYAHALGTMHMMRMLLKRILLIQGFSPQLFQDLEIYFPEVFKNKEFNQQDIIIQHMLIAALLQDIGELPFMQGTKHFFNPSDSLKKSVANSVGFEIKNWNNKNIFTVACIYSGHIVKLLDNLSLSFIVFLITGKSHPDLKLSENKNLSQLRHIIDGVVDADRLDYVFRDAHHTIGAFGTSSSVINSLLYYDEFGPVFSDPGPVANFLANRGHLYSTVYLDYANRFNVLLLVNFLKGILSSEDCTKNCFDTLRPNELSLEDFLELDDVSLISHMTHFSSTKNERQLPQKSRNALKLLVGQDLEYICFWLPRKNDTKPINNIELPDDLYFDTFNNQKHLIYRANSVRIQASKFQEIGNTIPLEECGGSFSAMLKNKWSVLPMPESILIFAPKKRIQGAWQEFQRGLEEGWLYNQLLENDPLSQTNPICQVNQSILENKDQDGDKNLNQNQTQKQSIIINNIISNSVEAKAVTQGNTNQSGNFGIGHMSGGTINEGAKVAGIINEAQQKSIAEVATEIQQLLEQLSNTYPTSNKVEELTLVTKAVEQIENNSNLKAKFVSALKNVGIETFKEAVNHPLINILVAAVDGWQNVE